MGVGTSVFLIALGAILDFAVNVNSPNLNIHAIGVVLMLVGLVGLVLSFLFWNSWGGSGIRRQSAVYSEPIRPVYNQVPVAPAAPVVSQVPVASPVVSQVPVRRSVYRQAAVESPAVYPDAAQPVVHRQVVEERYQ